MPFPIQAELDIFSDKVVSWDNLRQKILCVQAYNLMKGKPGTGQNVDVEVRPEPL